MSGSPMCFYMWVVSKLFEKQVGHKEEVKLGFHCYCTLHQSCHYRVKDTVHLLSNSAVPIPFCIFHTLILPTQILPFLQAWPPIIPTVKAFLNYADMHRQATG